MIVPARRALRRFVYIVMTLIGLSLAAAGLAEVAPPGAGPHLAMRLIPESASPAPGRTVTLAIAVDPAPGWHGYWKNPGDAGIETLAAWTLPAGLRAGPLRYPVPQRLLVAGLMNHVYDKPFALLVDLSVPAGLARGTALPVRVKLDYLVCTDTVCVPESQTLATRLTVGDGGADPQVTAKFDGWRRAIPRPLGAEATYQVADKRFRLSIPFPAGAALGQAWFYPEAAGALDYAAKQNVTRDGDRLLVETAAAASPAGGRIQGVLDTGAGQGLEIVAAPGSVAVQAGAQPGGWAATAMLAFLGAVAGGLILNVMPCVFPILSLKALSLARAGHGSEVAARREALAYTGGVVLVCLALGGAILALRAGGSAVGWAFQLQDPRMILILLLLSVAIALNLAGLFEVPMPRFAGEGGNGGAFATGALAAFVATPCTGPFMGAALGAALVLPWPAALAVFAGLGLGLALPFLLLGFIPSLRRRLPRPGAWMERLRRILSVPMWLTAIALAWVLGRQAGVEAMTLALALSLAIGLLLWFAGTRQRGGRGFGAAAAGGLALVALAGALIVPTSRPAAALAAGSGAERFSEARLAALRAGNRPVFAYFTADWCLTCKVNEKAAIETAATADAFRRGKVAVLVGDWTDGDPELGRFIERHNRAGVPLYLWYAPGSAEPRVLPQILTPAMLAELAARG
ncbi:thiol:disulfide interchange protein DsbD [Sphingomonas metalli]|uniref:Thiol:disulfide interchange protein DsbD n=1 Tax=Sphingomonas metalli TaxID=1779358 RepID=A0A916SSR3_9SPHN|nr:protein-disulfide reductase DsbD domain-containing protein [Sphingomonas metalli]GGB16247.1 thiol:disulfide interchange protein DsbD [Sphingomonas metalli]